MSQPQNPRQPIEPGRQNQPKPGEKNPSREQTSNRPEEQTPGRANDKKDKSPY